MRAIRLSCGLTAQVSDCDFPELSKHRWHAVHSSSTLSYAIHATTRAFMHVLILGKRKGYVVDHISGDGLNNQRENLRHATVRQNAWNRKAHKNCYNGLKGVYGHPTTGFHAFVSAFEERAYLGSFTTAWEAALAYNAAAIRFHGEFARLNSNEKLLDAGAPIGQLGTAIEREVQSMSVSEKYKFLKRLKASPLPKAPVSIERKWEALRARRIHSQIFESPKEEPFKNPDVRTNIIPVDF